MKKQQYIIFSDIMKRQELKKGDYFRMTKKCWCLGKHIKVPAIFRVDEKYSLGSKEIVGDLMIRQIKKKRNHVQWICSTHLCSHGCKLKIEKITEKDLAAEFL